MRPQLDIQIETPEPYTYKPPPPVDDAGFMRDLGLGVAIAIAAIAIVVVAIRKLRDHKLSAAANLVDHEAVTLTGVVRAKDNRTLVAPLSGRACVAHDTRVTYLGAPGSSEGRGVFGAVPTSTDGGSTLVAEVPFELELRDGKRVQIEGPLAYAVAPYRLPPDPTRERALLETLGRVDQDRRAGFSEIAIEPGAKLAIRGMLRVELDPSATAERGYRDDAPSRMRLVTDGDTRVTIVRVWDAS
jgi:hypothetical protein